MPTREDFCRCFKKLTEDEYRRLVGFMDKPTFKEELMNKFPALATDSELVSILPSISLILQYFKQKVFFEE
jgi:hypothetical protein